ncbi:DMT family transporter [Sphingomonas sp. 4RDLI-65]|uniref:DMT family transporter n=1 Tax=Sphingomonas sp. 4RDLI-65 TaxID=3111641 RepID=UPI003C232C92
MSTDILSRSPGARLMAIGGVPLAFLAYAAFAFSDASVRLLDGALSPFQLTFTGALLGLVALPFVRTPGDRMRDVFSATRRSLWLARAIGSSISTISSVVAFTRLPMPEAFALIFLMPLLVTLLSMLFLHEQIGRFRWAAVGIGFVGVLMVLRPGLRAFHLGHAAALTCALSSAIVIVLFRAGGAGEKRISMLGAGLVGPLVINGALLIWLQAFRWPDGHEMLLLASYGLLAILGQALLMLAAQRVEVSRIAPPQYSQMIWAVGLSYLVFHQHVDAPTFAGIAVIIGAGLLTWAREQVRLPSWRRRFALRPR